MQASELATAAVRVATGGAPVAAAQKKAVQELVWGRLGGSTLGASALARLHEQPGEGSAGIVASVLADELRADPEFAERVARALQAPQSSSPLPPEPAARRRAASAPAPPSYPPRPAAAPVQVPRAADVRNILLLGFPQAMLAYTVAYIAKENGAGAAVEILILLVSTGLTGYGVWLGVRLFLRRVRSGALICAVVFNVLVLIRLLDWLVGSALSA
ncbi:hypothetical protein KV205_32050 [Streptomyces sp. SKN60]|uniref:hypothetical protein n=1 Tax=Streptomyces sp. SKN60 TaxID=2855506 RepID=UPI00224869E8|nr:hypothetical protein [Streptomyces sp. SKN60]MCX2185108.1 hypothetical protein [Streptomyces sp. SKN60]